MAPNVIAATSYQRFQVRSASAEVAISQDCAEDMELKARMEENPEIKDAIEQFRKGLPPYSLSLYIIVN